MSPQNQVAEIPDAGRLFRTDPGRNCYWPLPFHDSIPSIGTDEAPVLEKTYAANDPVLRCAVILVYLIRRRRASHKLLKHNLNSIDLSLSLWDRRLVPEPPKTF